MLLRKLIQRKALGAALVAAALLVGACGGSSGGTANQPVKNLGTINVIIGPKSIEFEAATYGVDLGVWKKRGLDVQNVSVSGGGQVAQAIAANAGDIGMTGGPNAATAIVKGLNAKIVGAASYSFSGMVLVVKKESTAKTAADLKGKTFGISGVGSLTDFVVGKMADKMGWKLGTDYKKATVGGLDQLTAALQSGAIDAFAWSPEPAFLLQEKNQGKVIGDMGALVGSNLFEVIMANTNSIRDKKDAVQAYLDGYYEAVRYMASHAKETQKYMADDMGLSAFVVKSTYDLEMKNLSTDGSASQEQLNGVATSIATGGNTPSLTSFWDPEFIPSKK